MAKKKVIKKVAAKTRKPSRLFSKSPIEQALVHGGGRLPGTQNKSTIEIKNRLAELDCDPLAFATKLLNGEDTPQAHPFLAHLMKSLRRLFTLQRRLSKLKDSPPDVKTLEDFEIILNELHGNGKYMLGTGTWLDPKIKARIALELLNYIYPKQQSITHQGNEIDPTTPIEELTDQQLILIAVQVMERKGSAAELGDLRKQLLLPNA